MIRIIVATSDASRAANVGGPLNVNYKTFDVEAPALERYMAMASLAPPNSLVDRTIVGVEILKGDV